MSKKEKPHYVNNREFSEAVVEYCKRLQEARETGDKLPVVTDYIADCFLRIATGLSHKANFLRYTYREEMVMDAVENCLKAIENYNIETATRTGKPNAFAYFTQISWYAFLRRIEKEKKQQDIKLKYMAEAGLEEIIHADKDDNDNQAFVDVLRDRIDAIKENDRLVGSYVKTEKRKRRKTADSDLSDFLEDE